MKKPLFTIPEPTQKEIEDFARKNLSKVVKQLDDEHEHRADLIQEELEKIAIVARYNTGVAMLWSLKHNNKPN